MKKLIKLQHPIKVIHVVGARPNFMKVAPIMREMFKYPQKFDQILIHTGQHYDNEMSKYFFKDLELPKPDIYLEVGSGTHAEQTGKIMIKFEKVCFREKPDLVIVYGDVNSTISCALAAAKLLISIAHIEAGLRSFDRTMPEEINRIITDQISDYLFTTCEDANYNLIKEGTPENKIFFVGNVMIDTLLKNMKKAENSNILENLGLKNKINKTKYAIVTLHRPSNVDDPKKLEGILNALNILSNEIPIIFPAHPRTFRKIKNFKLAKVINYKGNFLSKEIKKPIRNIKIIPPLSYFDFLCLMSNASIVLTDSGGIQEETTILGVPCLTLRNNTERPITLKVGTNILVGNNPKNIINKVRSILNNGKSRIKIPKYWDGKAAKRIVKILLKT